LGLLDTGATLTCIDPQVIQSLGVQPRNKTLIVGLGTDPAGILCNLYRVSLTVVHPISSPRLDWVNNYVALTEAALKHTGVDVVLGWDLLARCLLVSDGPAGFFSLAY
jgi:hypothetical protein